MLADLKDIGLTLIEAALLSDKELKQRSLQGNHWLYRLRTVQIDAGIETPIVNRERYYRQADDVGLREDICNALANASLNVENAADMSDAELENVKGLGRCGLAILRSKQVELGLQSYHIKMFKLSRFALHLGVSQRGVNALIREKLTLEDTSKLTDAELSKFSGIARATVGEIRQLELAWFPDL